MWKPPGHRPGGIYGGRGVPQVQFYLEKLLSHRNVILSVASEHIKTEAPCPKPAPTQRRSLEKPCAPCRGGSASLEQAMSPWVVGELRRRPKRKLAFICLMPINIFKNQSSNFVHPCDESFFQDAIKLQPVSTCRRNNYTPELEYIVFCNLATAIFIPSGGIYGGRGVLAHACFLEKLLSRRNVFLRCASCN